MIIITISGYNFESSDYTVANTLLKIQAEYNISQFLLGSLDILFMTTPDHHYTVLKASPRPDSPFILYSLQ